jgi:tight adherence protein C
VAPEVLLAAGLAALFAGVALALVTVGSLSGDRQRVSRSLAAVQRTQVSPGAGHDELDRPFADRVVLPVLDGLSRAARRVTSAGTADGIRRRLEYAGSPDGWDVDRVLAFKVLGMLVGLVLGLSLPLLLGQGLLVALGVTCGLALVGFFAADAVLYQAVHDRQQRMRRDLPDAIDLLTISVEAGLGFEAAMSQVARNTEGPLAAELFRVLQEMQIGLGRVEAMRALAERTRIPELRSFVSAMVQAEAFGIPIANVLRVQSRELRVKRRQWAEEAAQKVPVKILFPLIFLVMPSLFVVILGPAVLQMIDVFR